MMTSVPIGPVKDNPLGAAGDMVRNYSDMLEAGFIGGDKYFHCKEIAKPRSAGCWVAGRRRKMSDLREIYQQRVKGETRKDAVEDQRANHLGRNGAQLYPERSCQEICRPVRPNGLPGGY